MYQTVEGFCVTWDKIGIPRMEECEVKQVSDEYFITTDVDREGNGIVTGTFQFGRTFFYHRLPALTELRNLLDNALHGHQRAMNTIQSAINSTIRQIGQETGVPFGDQGR